MEEKKVENDFRIWRELVEEMGGEARKAWWKETLSLSSAVQSSNEMTLIFFNFFPSKKNFFIYRLRTTRCHTPSTRPPAGLSGSSVSFFSPSLAAEQKVWVVWASVVPLTWWEGGTVAKGVGEHPLHVLRLENQEKGEIGETWKGDEKSNCLSALTDGRKGW